MSIQLNSYREKNNTKAVLIFLGSLLPFLTLMVLCLVLIQHSILWVLFFTWPLHWFHARLFVIMHDCGHHSFTSSAKLNNLIGHTCGFFFLTPFLLWRQLHNRHHLHQGNLDRRGISLDVWLLTKSEYQNAHSIVKLSYRFYRNPAILFLLSPLVLFGGLFRLPFEYFPLKARLNIWILNFIYFLFAFQLLSGSSASVILAFIPFMLLSFSLAAWLFYIQHTFEKTLWLKDSEFQNREIALHGSSYYQLPRFLNWMTANIGFHHVHHLDTQIPLYRLRQAHDELILNEVVESLDFYKSFETSNLKLWDENKRKLIGF